MKKSELKELIKLGEKAISAKILEAQKFITEHELESSRGGAKNPRARKEARAIIARLKTALKEVKK